MAANLEQFEVVVVGGGAAGLSAAVVLSRARRSVLVIDDDRPRNAPAAGIHSYLTRDGMPPREFLAAGRAELGAYGGHFRPGRVDRIEADGAGFVVGIEGAEAVRADRILVATGLVDRLPPVPGLAERFGRDVLHCPYCHGWEVRDEPIAVLGTGPAAAEQALMWRQWSDRVTVLRHTAGDFGAEQDERLAALGVDVVDGEVVGLEVAADRLSAAVLADGRSVRCAALVVATVLTAAAGPLERLGARTAELERGGSVIGTYVEADPTGATTVPGVWVAGNVTGPMAQVIGAAESGVRAAGAINADLTEQRTRQALDRHRAALRR